MSDPKTPPPGGRPPASGTPAGAPGAGTPHPTLIDDPIHGDWTKQTWDLPPYKSAEFFKYVPESELDHFRTLPVYKFAVQKGVIKDDEWVGKPGDKDKK